MRARRPRIAIAVPGLALAVWGLAGAGCAPRDGSARNREQDGGGGDVAATATIPPSAPEGAGGSSRPRAPVEAAVPLDAGASIERALAEGETHRYSLLAAEGDFLRLTAEQRGVDLILAIEPLAGGEKLTIDSPTGGAGEETFEWVAERPGEGLVAVRAFPGSRPGRYVLRLEARPAGAEDRRRAAACAAYWRAEQAVREGGVPALARAEVEFLDAAAGYRALGDRPRELASLRRLGEIHIARGQDATAVPLLEQALGLARRLGDRRAELHVLNDLAYAYRREGERRRAAATAEQALDLARALADRSGMAVAFNNLGLARRDLGQFQEAMIAFREALAAWESTGDRVRQALALENLGSCSTRIGRDEEGRLLLERALAIEEELGQIQVSTLIELAWVYHLEGTPERALPLFGRGLDLARASGDRHAEAGTLDRRGTALRALGRIAEAEADHHAALFIVRETGDDAGAAHVLTNLGADALRRGEARLARQRYAEALELAQEAVDPSAEAAIFIGLARSARALGELESARARLEEAVSRTEDLRAGLGSRTLRSDYLAVHYEAFEELVDLLMELHGRDPAAGFDRRAFAVAERARALALREALSEARVGGRRQAPSELIARERRRIGEIEALEGQRLDLVAADPGSRRAAALAAEIRLAWIEVETLQAEIESAGAVAVEPPLEAGDVQRRLLDSETVLLAYSLGETRSFLWVVSRDRLATRILPGKDRIEELARGFHRRLSRRPAASSADAGVDAFGRELARLVLAPAAGALTARRFVVIPDGALVYVPFAALPAPDGRGRPLVADHDLVTLPSASVLVTLRTEAEQRPPRRGVVAVLADPVFSADDARVAAERTYRDASSGREGDRAPLARRVEQPADDLTRAARDIGLHRFDRLPWTSEEADAIVAAAGRRESLVARGFEANRELVESGVLAGFDVVHIASHGVLDEAQPDLSGVVLSLVDREGRQRDGFLRAHELADLDLRVDLVVLSACRTGLGREVRGEGLIGLTQGLFSAGARRVVVSHWGVDDRATAELMRRFYRALLADGLPPAAALNRAQRDLLAGGRWQAPYFWAAFVLQGDWL